MGVGSRCRVEAAGPGWPPKPCGGRSFPCSLLWRLGREALGSQTSEAACGEPEGLAVAEGGNHCLELLAV